MNVGIKKGPQFGIKLISDNLFIPQVIPSDLKLYIVEKAPQLGNTLISDNLFIDPVIP